MTETDRKVSQMRATAHPVRLQILSLLTGAEMSAAEIARELDISHANASYHLRFLADAGLVVEAGEEKIRGGVAKRYRHPWDVLLHDPDATREDADQYVRAMAEELVRRYAGRQHARGHGTRLTDADLWVDRKVWERASALVEEAATLVHAEARPPRTPGTVRVGMTSAMFVIEDPEAAAEDDATGPEGSSGDTPTGTTRSSRRTRSTRSTDPEDHR